VDRHANFVGLKSGIPLQLLLHVLADAVIGHDLI
jgi:hypothetical protein